MSTLAGNAAKGEKGKSGKYATLDINTLYKSKGNEQEVQLQKNTAPRKHGLQKLGTLPSARRPTNLPSLKSESSSGDSTVTNIVSGSGTRWGNKPGESNQTPQPTTTVATTLTQDVPVNSSTAGISQQAQHVQPHPSMAGIPNVHAMAHMPHPSSQELKSWAMMTHADAAGMMTPSFLTHQSPLFQQEFPSLSSDTKNGVNVSTSRNANTGAGDTQYGPGPSLRPQTEGSWIQGGNRSQGMIGQGPGNQSASAPAQGHQMISYPHIGVDGVRNNLGQSGAVVVPGGPYAPGMIPHQLLPPQFRSVIPPFMLRNYPSGFPPPNFQPQLQHPPPLQPPPPHNRMSPRPCAPTQSDSHSPRDSITPPISAPLEETKSNKSSPAKEDDTKTNDSLEETSWAYCVEDYLKSKASENDNQTDNKNDNPKTEDVENKSFKDGYGEPLRIQLMTRDKLVSNYEPKFPESRQQIQRGIQPPQQAGVDHRSHIPPRFQNNVVHRNVEEEDPERRRVDALLRAKQRKEEEEKRFIESREAAAKKLKILEEKMASSQDTKENKPPSSVYGGREANIPLPDWDKEKPKLTTMKSVDEIGSIDSSKKLPPSSSTAIRIPVVRDASEFKELTQIGDKNTFSRIKDKDSSYSSSGSYSRHTNDIPPRFQKQQQGNISLMQRQNSGVNLNVLQQSDLRKNNAFQQPPYSIKPAMPISRRDRKDSDMSSVDNDKWEDEQRRKDHYGPDNEYNVEKERYSRNYRNDHEKNGRDNEYRERNSYLECSSMRDQERDYNKRNTNFYTDSSLPRDSEWEQHDRDRIRNYDRDMESENRRPPSRLELMSRDTSDRNRNDHGQESDRNREWEQEREREMERNYEYDRDYRRNVPPPSHFDAPYRNRDPDPKRITYCIDPQERNAPRANEYEEQSWEKPVTENERDRRRDYNNHNSARISSEPVDKEREVRRRSSYEYDSYDNVNKYTTDKGRDRDVHKMENYLNRNQEKRDRDLDYEIKNEEYRNDYEYEKRDRDYEQRADVRHDKHMPVIKNDPHDNRTRKDSRNSRESLHEEPLYDDFRTSHSSWAEETEMAIKYSRRDTNFSYKEERGETHRDHYIHHPRHIPGPITRERLEAVKPEQESKANLTQLVRSTDKRNKKPENTMIESSDSTVNSISDTPDKTEIKRDDKTSTAEKIDSAEKPSSLQSVDDNKSDHQKDTKEKDIPAPAEGTSSNDKVTSYSSNVENIPPKYPPSDRNERGGPKPERHDKPPKSRRSQSHTIYNSKRERNPHQRNPSSRYPRWQPPPLLIRDKKQDWINHDYSVEDIPFESRKEEKHNGPGIENRLTNRNGRAPVRKSERNDRNYDYRQPSDAGDFYSNSNNRKYDSPRSNNREHNQSGSYNEPVRRGRGGFTGRSGYGPPSTKRPFTQKHTTTGPNAPTPVLSANTAQSESDKKSTSEKEKIQPQPLMSASEKYSSSTHGTTLEKQESSGNESSLQEINKHDTQLRTNNSKDNRNLKTKRSPIYQSNAYKHSAPLVTVGSTVSIEAEEAWETASEGTSANGDGTVRNRQNRQSPSMRSSKPPRRTIGHRSSSGKRAYDTRRSTGPKRETQQFYDCRSVVNKKLAREKAASEEKENIANSAEADNSKKSSIADNDNKTKASSERSGRHSRERKNTSGNEYIDKYSMDYHRPPPHNKRLNAKDNRGGGRQKPEPPINRLPPHMSKSSSVPIKDIGYSSRSTTSRYHTDRRDYGEIADGRKHVRNNGSGFDNFAIGKLGPPKMAPAPTVNAWNKPITISFKSSSPPPSQSSATSKKIINNDDDSSNSNNNTTDANSSVRTVNVKDIDGETLTIEAAGKLVVTTSQQKRNVTTIVATENYSATEKDLTSTTVKVAATSSSSLETMIIENTHYKGPTETTGVASSKNKYESQHLKTVDGLTASNFESQVSTTDQSSLTTANKHNPMEMALDFSKAEDGSDMKLDFTFDPADLAEDNKSGKSLEVTHSIQLAQTATAADLNYKIASVKKVWEDGSLVQFEDENGVIASSSFASSFNPELNDNVCYVKNESNSPSNVQVDNVTLTHTEDYCPVTQIQVVNTSYGVVPSNCQPVVIKGDPNSSSTNVCKVKPQPQSVGGNVATVTTLTTISSVAPLTAHTPPVSSPSFAFSPPTPQPNLTGNATAVALAAAAHINFQAAAQYNSMPPIPSPPTVLFSSSQQLAGGAPPAPTGLYQAYQIESTQVISNQPPRSQFGQYPTAYGISNGLGQTSGFNQQSVYVHQAGPPPPPPAITAAPQDMYPSQLSQYRMQPPPPPPNYGNSQQIGASPNTVLISTSSNSLMSATVKPPPAPQQSQQIAAMNAKSAYSAQQPQIYIPFEPTQVLSQNYISGNQMVPQRPGGNIPPPTGMPPASSYFNAGSSAEHFSIHTSGQGGYFQGNANSIQPQPATPYGLSAFSAQSPPSAIQTFSSQVNPSFRGPYVKGNSPADMANKAIIANTHEMLTTVYPTGPQQMTSSSKPQRIQNTNKSMMQTGHQALNQPPQHTIPQHGSYTYPPPNQTIPHHHVHPPPPPQHHHHQRSGNVNAGAVANIRSNQYPLPPIQRPMNPNIISRNSNHGGGNNNSNNGGGSNNSGNQRGGAAGGGAPIRDNTRIRG